MRSLDSKFVLAASALLLTAFSARAADPPALDDDLLPYCWGVRSSYEAPPGETQQMANKFGAKVDKIDNVEINAAGIPLQVNIVYCSSEGEARKALRFFRGLGQPDWKYVRAGKRVYEFMCNNTLVVKKVKSLLGLLDDRPRKWRVEMEVAPLERSHDDMKWNRFFTAAAAHRKDASDEDAIMEILDLAPNFEFGNVLSVANEDVPWGRPRYEFTPAPSERYEAGDRLVAAFEALPKTVEIPRVKIDAEISTRAFGAYPSDRMDDHYKYALLRATDPWPIAHGEIRRVLAECYEIGWSPRRNLESIACWVYHNIEYKGDVTGSRYGTLAVLEQRFGHCWDKADVLISMLRMVRIPCRLVFGWLYGVGGHVWVQAYLDEEGWISIDPTCSWLGVTDEYIPLFISEDGHPPFVYTDFPEIAPLD